MSDCLCLMVHCITSFHQCCTHVFNSQVASTCLFFFSFKIIPYKHVLCVYLMFGGFVFQGLTDHSCSPLSSGEHVINSPEPTHGKYFLLNTQHR